MYKLTTFVKSERCAIDLLVAGEITQTEFSIHQVMLLHGGWGYASRTRSLPWTQWAEITHLSVKWLKKSVDSLVSKGLLYKYPYKAASPPRFILFQEALTKLEQQPYIDYLNENQNFSRVPNKINPDGSSIEADVKEFDPLKKHAKLRRMYPQEIEHEGYRFKYDGTLVKRWDGSNWENVFNYPPEVEQKLYTNPMEHIKEENA